MTPALSAWNLGKRFHRVWGLRECTLTIPEGAIVGLVGPNAAGKSTLLALAAGLLAPSEGSLAVLGRDPRAEPAVLTEVGFLPQGAPLYRSFTVSQAIEFTKRTNLCWDAEIVAGPLARFDSAAKVGSLSTGSRTQLALALALGTRPRLLLLDEPFAGLDPFACREFLQLLMDGVAVLSPTVVIASHVMADIERVCDEVVLLAEGRVRVEGLVESLLESHRILMGPRRPIGAIRGVREIVRERHVGRQATLLVRVDGPILDPSWTVERVGLEELLLAYISFDRLQPRKPPEGLPLQWHG
jgi:ABC-2 type transport system ATP-binding protein